MLREVIDEKKKTARGQWELERREEKIKKMKEKRKDKYKGGMF